MSAKCVQMQTGVFTKLTELVIDALRVFFRPSIDVSDAVDLLNAYFRFANRHHLSITFTWNYLFAKSLNCLQTLFFSQYREIRMLPTLIHRLWKNFPKIIFIVFLFIYWYSVIVLFLAMVKRESQSI